MNKELEQKNKEEIDLIFDFEMAQNWSDDIHKEFDKKWKQIQKRHRDIIL